MLPEFALLLVRFIPTHMGNTAASIAFWVAIPVHPHAYGEHVIPSVLLFCAIGSSPRIWGTHETAPAAGVELRFIPTHMGNTKNPPSFLTRASVHPHAYGEHLSYRYHSVSAAGSSPRIWGTQRYAASILGFERFIPTHMGNTITIQRKDARITVHPHAYGEHFCRLTSSRHLAGSSPRIWGTPSRVGF